MGRLRGVGQLGACRWVFPCAVHNRFEHSLGVAHLARTWTEHFQRSQPELGIDDADILCVTLAGLLHDLGHGPFSHFWDGVFLPASTKDEAWCHEDTSCAIIDRLRARNAIDVTPWLQPDDWTFIQALIRGAPPQEGTIPSEQRERLRLGPKGVAGKDKRFLYDIVANTR